MKPNRREFIKDSMQVVASLGIASWGGSAYGFTSPREVSPKDSANEIIRIGLIGCRNMGWSDLSSMLTHENVVCVALCDVDENVLKAKSAELEKKTGKKPTLYHDHRELLANKDIDAVIIGTPDHWHCIQMVEACAAGKDVYVEKPIGNSIEECNLMVAAKNKYQRVVQVGQWQRSDTHWISALDFLHSGQLGRIRSTKSWACVSYGRDFNVKPDAQAPVGVDYDLWLGPAPKKPFNPNRFHGNFRYFWDYAGGLMTDWGVHMIDMVLAGMKVDVPISASAVGGKYGYPDNAGETPDSLYTVYDFGNFSMQWEQTFGVGRGPYNQDTGEPGVAFIGNNGTLVINRTKWQVYPELNNGKPMLETPEIVFSKSNGLDHHTLNFLNCIRSRQQPNCTIEMGRNAAITAQLGNIAYRTKTKVFWDDKNNRIANNKDAEKMAKAHYRSPWKIPTI